MRSPAQILTLLIQILSAFTTAAPLLPHHRRASMATLLYHAFSFLSLFSFGLYHLISSTRSLLKPPPPSAARAAASDSSYSARPYHPLPLSSPLRHLPLHLALLSLLISIAHYTLLSSGAQRLTSLQHSAALLLFFLLALSLLLPPALSLPPDLLFLLAALAFILLSAASAHSAALYPDTDLQSHASSLSSLISLTSAALSLALALLPHLFIASFALAASLALQGLWSLQTGLSLYVDNFIPEGCHRLLDVPDPSTRCDLEDSRLRAAALLDLAFVLHATFVAIVATIVYVAVARISGGPAHLRRQNGGSYEALPTSSSASALPGLDQIQMKAISKSSTQA